jgi:hypothetical protein
MPLQDVLKKNKFNKLSHLAFCIFLKKLGPYAEQWEKRVVPQFEI